MRKRIKTSHQGGTPRKGDTITGLTSGATTKVVKVSYRVTGSFSLFWWRVRYWFRTMWVVGSPFLAWQMATSDGGDDWAARVSPAESLETELSYWEADE